MNNRRALSPTHPYSDPASVYNNNNAPYISNNRRNNNGNLSRNNSMLPPRTNTPGRSFMTENQSPMRGGYYQPLMHRDQSLYYDVGPPPALSRSQTPVVRPPSRAQSPMPIRSMGGPIIPPPIPNYTIQPSYSNDSVPPMTGYYPPPPPYRSSSPFLQPQQQPQFIDVSHSQVQYNNRLREENEFLFAATLSEQDNLYGTNMTENLTVEDDHYIRHLMSTGFTEFDALKANFERKVNHPRNINRVSCYCDCIVDNIHTILMILLFPLSPLV